MASNDTPIKLMGLAKRLVINGLITQNNLIAAQKAAIDESKSLIDYLVDEKILTESNLSLTSSEEFGITLFDIKSLDLNLVNFDIVPEKLIHQHQVLPLFVRNKDLYIALSDPTNQQAIDDLRHSTNMNIRPVLIEKQALLSTIESMFYEYQQTVNINSSTDDQDSDEVTLDDKNAPPIVRFINDILVTAIQDGASDVHFEPYETIYRIRTRTDGILHEAQTAPIEEGNRIAARLKVLSRLNIAERRIPQDGRMRLRLSETRAIDFRVNTCPILFGEKIVLRILDSSSAQLGIDALGYEEEQKAIFLKIMHQPYGMILVTGPTGSGKTVSLYTAINILNTEDRNISTVEDPAEITLPGINQVNVNPSIGLTFSSALRAFLRQDPDIIMVGEIRDLETAEIAIKAAQTGHMVFSTLHTNDAPQTLARLANMGVPAFNIATAVSLIIAQRLARRLCEKCKVTDNLPNDVLLNEGFSQQQIDAGITIYKAVGCPHCSEGYKGRVGIYQVMPVSEVMSKIIMEDGNALQLAEQAQKEGVNDLMQSGLIKVAKGTTSIEEFNRVTKE